MKLHLRARAVVAPCAIFLLSACQPAPDSPAQLSVTGAWARVTPAATHVGAAYFTIHNRTPEADTLLSVASPVAAQAQLHRTLIADGMARMRPAGMVPVPAGHSVKAEPGGLHVMLYELVRPLVEGEAVPLTLTFARAGAVTVTLEVRSAASGALHAHVRY